MPTLPPLLQVSKFWGQRRSYIFNYPDRWFPPSAEEKAGGDPPDQTAADFKDQRDGLSNLLNALA